MSSPVKKTLGQAIDDIIAALETLDEDARGTAIRAACEHLGIASAQVPQSPQVETPSVSSVDTPAGVAPSPDNNPATDIPTIKPKTRPSTAQEMACVVAYYLQSLAPPNERTREIGISDLEKYFIQAGFQLPRRIPQVLIDAKGAGYFDSAARGKYKLNPVGHNLVVHSLPKAKK